MNAEVLQPQRGATMRAVVCAPRIQDFSPDPFPLTRPSFAPMPIGRRLLEVLSECCTRIGLRLIGSVPMATSVQMLNEKM